jgi:signal transduction histidine kinase/phage shock protein PspC (stress-responsive transcriptional regulator)
MTLQRDVEHRVVAGVLAGIAARLRVDPVIVRVAFVLIVVASGGLALLAYLMAWWLIPSGVGEAVPPADRAGERPARRFPSGGRVAAGVGLVTLAALLAFRELGIWWSDALVWPLVLAASGVTLLWWQMRSSSAETPPPAAPAATSASPAEPSVAVSEQQPRSRFAELYKGGFGVALVVGAALLFLSANDALGAARDVAFTVIVVVLAFALIAAPFLWRLGRNLASERAERIRSQERADLAAHLHDSVLQTLTLMQKRADDPREVATLARRQERELRSWLFGRDQAAEGASFSAALRAAADEVEDAHAVAVELVAVGDCPLDEHSEAVVAAAREAITNAAKFAPDSGPISVYAEVENGSIEAFVHDRGPGFDPASLPDDRRGVRESILGRMQRHGGHAEIRSTPGEGTEVKLTLERSEP